MNYLIMHFCVKLSKITVYNDNMASNGYKGYVYLISFIRVIAKKCNPLQCQHHTIFCYRIMHLLIIYAFNFLSSIIDFFAFNHNICI